MASLIERRLMRLEALEGLRGRVRYDIGASPNEDAGEWVSAPPMSEAAWLAAFKPIGAPGQGS